MAPIIQIRGLSKVYVQDVIGTEHGRLKIRLKDRRRVALENLDLDVEEGQIFGLLGPNGAGKTTTIKILMGLHFQTAGTATMMGRPLGDNAVKGQIGFLPENPFFYDYLTGEEFLNFYGQLYGMTGAARRKRIPELLDLVGLSKAANIPLRGYSKGMLQRAGLAQALLNDPRLVILDEPQSGLDPFGRKEVRDIILRLKEQGKTVMFSSHILADAEMICDRVAILHLGRLIAEGHLSELLSTRIDEYEVQMRNPAADLLAFVHKAAHKVVDSKGDHFASFKAERDALEVTRRLASGEGTLMAYVPRRESLEDYFIREIEGKRAQERAQVGKENAT
ncbi:MAG: ABC transporter ATP-binding protein [Candidatus Sumerlaeia bacterium]|nr:ABC transporter ATP-binding protein [Candidatus Sumerlaeia bacterium]